LRCHLEVKSQAQITQITYPLVTVRLRTSCNCPPSFSFYYWTADVGFLEDQIDVNIIIQDKIAAFSLLNEQYILCQLSSMLSETGPKIKAARLQSHGSIMIK
jgi:hypothetical protein